MRLEPALWLSEPTMWAVIYLILFFHVQTAPIAVSDAAMLAPEEIFSGKGDIKDETELTQAERKRRRANKKRKYKGTIQQLTISLEWTVRGTPL